MENILSQAYFASLSHACICWKEAGLPTAHCSASHASAYPIPAWGAHSFSIQSYPGFKV